MQYEIYKFEFTSAVHFGEGMLNESGYSFTADRLFSALYIEAMRQGLEEELLYFVKEGGLRFSDAFPYTDDRYLLPKPVMYIAPQDQGDSVQKKFYKNLKYIPAEDMESFVKGRYVPGDNPMEGFGKYVQRNIAAVSMVGDTEPFYVGTYEYEPGNGLYVIVGYEGDEELELAEILLESLSYTGIGGKKTSGLGKFNLKKGKMDKSLQKMLESSQGSGTRMLLCGALPRDEEMEGALEGATYLLELRSGYVASDTHAPELVRKKDLYMVAAGSCFHEPFGGDVYNVSKGGAHPVYRYGIAMFAGISQA